uniref:Uncharacterized protein n=1 Tax=Anolis carolinensis TaxID=28377 RepID=A0A803T9U7_ANOCA
KDWANNSSPGSKQPRAIRVPPRLMDSISALSRVTLLLILLYHVPFAPLLCCLPFFQTQYFIPVTDAEFRERLERHRGEIAIMLRSSEFNQDKTTLIVTNNPLPLLISGRQLATPFQFFPKDFLRKVGFTNLSCPRFATRNDFKTEAHFSKNYDEKHLQKLYPNLRTHMRPGKKLFSTQGRKGRFPLSFAVPLVPLTMSCLIETKPTVTVPGEDGFRYGKAPLWIVNICLSCTIKLCI